MGKMVKRGVYGIAIMFYSLIKKLLQLLSTVFFLIFLHVRFLFGNGYLADITIRDTYVPTEATSCNIRSASKK